VRRALPLVLAVLAVGAPPRPAAAGADAERAARELDDPRWEVRRAAYATLLVDGRAALAATLDDAAPAAGAGLERWLETVHDRARSGSPTAAARARAVLGVVEAEAEAPTVRASPILLEARLRRLLPLAAVPHRAPPVDEDDERADTASLAREALALLLPEARPMLLATVARSHEATEVAAALSALSPEDGSGPDEETTAAIAKRFAADPAALEGTRDLDTPGAPWEAVTVVALALALSGRPADGVRLDRDHHLASRLRGRLVARGDADLTTGAFLDEMGEGRVTSADAEEAARRTAALGLPQFARAAARRALFLDPENARARSLLVEADVAAGLPETARRDADANTPVPPSRRVDDDPEAKAFDEAMRAGRFADRLAWSLEVGSTQRAGTPPVAIGSGFVACGRPDGRIALLDPATGEERSSVPVSPPVRLMREGLVSNVPRGLAIAKGRLAAVSNRGRFLVWALPTPERPMLDRPAADVGGPFGPHAAAPAGAFWIASEGRRIHRVAPGATEPVLAPKVPPSPDVVPVALHVLSSGALLMQTEMGLERIDPETGTVAEVFSGVARLACAALGDSVLLALGSAWGVVDRGALELRGEAPDDGEIVGLAGDAEAGVVYLTLVSETVAVRAKDGRVLWRRGVEGSANPVLGEGLLVVPAGSGDERFGGNGRKDRTLYALTTSRPPHDVFSEATVSRLLAAATAAVKEGRAPVGILMLDPVRDWAGPDLDAFDAAVRKARGVADPAPAVKPEPEEEPEPVPEPPPPPAPPEPDPAPAPKPGDR
jgi:hypothetical protein